MPNQLVLDRYRILDQAGSGGFATVYAAWDTSLQRKVAIKELQISELDAYRAQADKGPVRSQDVPPWEEDPAAGLEDLAFPADPAFLGGAPGQGPDDPVSIKLADVEQQRFFSHIPGLDEARAAAHLEDPNIVHVHDFQIVGTRAYIIMEYLDGITLTRFLRDFDDELTLDIIAAIFADVVHALETAHENQVLHLDIKPDNIIITKKGVVKVTDFGMAALSDLEGKAYTHGGTIGYMPLEQMRQESLDARCDEWALGSVTYEMLNGENPFMARDLPGAERAISNAELVLPSLMWDELDQEADDVLFYALDPDRDERYENVTDFAEEFQPFLGDVRAGRKALAKLISNPESAGDHYEPASFAPSISLKEHLTPKTLSVAGRMFAAITGAGITAISLSNVSLFGDMGLIVMLVSCIVAAAAGAFRPGWGALVTGIAWGGALLANQLWALGAISLAATVAWWLMAGKDGRAAGTIALFQPWSGFVSLPFVGPLLAGCFLRPLPAVLTAAYSAVLSFSFAAVGWGSLCGWGFFHVLHFSKGVMGPSEMAAQLAMTPGTWAIGISWIVAAAVLAVFRLRGTRVFSTIGLCLAVASCVAGLCAAQMLTAGGTNAAPDPFQIMLVILCGALVAAFLWLFDFALDDSRYEAALQYEEEFD